MSNEDINEQTVEDKNENAESVQEQNEEAVSENEEKGEAAGETVEEPKTELELANEKIALLEKENSELKDQVLRRAADFENYRKRSVQEKQDAFDYANTNLLKDLLDSLDNFDRTIEAAATATDPKSIADGVSMISKNMINMLETKYNLVSYGAAGDAFDPDIHEAIGKVDEPVAEPVLKAVYLKGYKLKERVIRHAKVMVSMPNGEKTE